MQERKLVGAPASPGIADLRYAAADLAETTSDPYMSSYFTAFGHNLDTNEEFRSTAQDVLNRRNMRPYMAAQLMFRAHQAIEQDLDPSYPSGRLSDTAWYPTFERTSDPDSDEYDTFQMHCRRHNQSNNADRGKTLVAIAALHGANRPVRVLEVGTSQMHLLKKLALYHTDSFGYSPTAVMRHEPGVDSEARIEGSPPIPTIEDKVRTKNFKRLIKAAPLKLGSSVGIDIWNPSDPEVYRWARSSSFYAAELMDYERTVAFDELTAANVPQVGFYLDSQFAGKFDHEKFEYSMAQRELSKLFDIVFLPTFLYLLSDAERKMVIANAEQRLDPDGLKLVVAQDFIANINEDESFDIRDNWPPFLYSTWGKDLKCDQPKFEKYFSLNSGRAGALVVEAAVRRMHRARQLGLASLTDQAY